MFGETDCGDDRDDQHDLCDHDGHVSESDLETGSVPQRAVWDELDQRMEHRLRGDARCDQLRQAPVPSAQAHPNPHHGCDDHAQRRNVQPRFTSHAVREHLDENGQYGGDGQHGSAARTERARTRHTHSLRPHG